MLFTTETFLVFSAIFFPIYFLVPSRFQLYVLLIASYIFYGWWDWRLLGLFWFSTLANFTLGRQIENSRGRPRENKAWLWTGVGLNLFILGIFKYFNFFIQTANQLEAAVGMKETFQVQNIILPVGISFYTFHTLSYIIDIYRGRIAPEPKLSRFAAYLALFPHLVAGPIVRASVLLPQFATPKRFRWTNFFLGAELIIIGFALKVVLADSLAPTVNRIFEDPHTANNLFIYIGVLFFSYQIYGDFAGYSMIAIGLGIIMGYRFRTNFRKPYISTSFSEFWRRWHISLSSWLRDYLYISLGGNRRGTLMTYRNLVLTMLLGGLWHGAAWKFVVWGGLHGGYLVLQRLIEPYWINLRTTLRMPRVISGAMAMAVVFALTCLAWIFFRANNMEDAIYIIQRLSQPGEYAWSGVQRQFQVLLGLAMIVTVMVLELGLQLRPVHRITRRNKVVRTLLACALLLIIPLFGTFAGAAFIYFQF